MRHKLRQRHLGIVDRRGIFDQGSAHQPFTWGWVMATVAASGNDRKSSERKFFSRMALFLVFLVLLGFAPSFYLKGIVPSYPRPNPTLPPWVILHGTIFSTWMLLLVAQTQLIGARKHAIHMQLGKFGIPKMDPNAFLKAVYASMKPGGVIGVIDHVANPNNDTRATVEKYHRIDPNVVKADFKRAGFLLVRSGNMLRNPEDDHTLLVFDPKVRGKTDRFVLEFRKPR